MTASTNPREDFQLNQKFMYYDYFSYKNNFDKIFLYSDKTLKSKRVSTINEPSNINQLFLSIYMSDFVDFKQKKGRP